MAPSQSQINKSHHPNQTQSPKIISRLGSSKAQLCLQKILHIILTVPEPNNDNTPTPAPNDEVPTTKVEDPLAQSPAAAVDGGEVAFEGEKVADSVVNKEIDDRSNGVEGGGGGDCMGLLIQAATLIFGEIKEENHEKTATATATAAAAGSDVKTAVNVKRRSNERWTVDLYGEKEPVVRSKRGRTQVLPGKYRDSVIEPLTRVSRNRPTLFPSKQRRLR